MEMLKKNQIRNTSPILVTLKSFSEFCIQSWDSGNTALTFRVSHSVARKLDRGDTAFLFKIAPRLNSPIYKNIFVREVVLMLHKKKEVSLRALRTLRKLKIKGNYDLGNQQQFLLGIT